MKDIFINFTFTEGNDYLVRVNEYPEGFCAEMVEDATSSYLYSDAGEDDFDGYHIVDTVMRSFEDIQWDFINVYNIGVD